MITDEQMLESLKTVRQYCKEHKNCNKCVFDKICTRCEYEEYEPPMYWKLPGDNEHDE